MQTKHGYNGFLGILSMQTCVSKPQPLLPPPLFFPNPRKLARISRGDEDGGYLLLMDYIHRRKDGAVLRIVCRDFLGTDKDIAHRCTLYTAKQWHQRLS